MGGNLKGEEEFEIFSCKWTCGQDLLNLVPTMQLLVLTFYDPWVKSREQRKEQPRFSLSGRCMSHLSKSKSDFKQKKRTTSATIFCCSFSHGWMYAVCTWKHVRSKSPFCNHVAVKDPKMLLIIFMSNSQKCIIFHCQHSPLSWVLSFICLLWCNLLFWSVMQCSHFPYCSHSHSKKQDFLLWCCIFRYRGFIPWHM